MFDLSGIDWQKLLEDSRKELQESRERLPGFKIIYEDGRFQMVPGKPAYTPPPDMALAQVIRH